MRRRQEREACGKQSRVTPEDPAEEDHSRWREERSLASRASPTAPKILEGVGSRVSLRRGLATSFPTINDVEGGKEDQNKGHTSYGYVGPRSARSMTSARCQNISKDAEFGRAEGRGREVRCLAGTIDVGQRRGCNRKLKDGKKRFAG